MPPNQQVRYHQRHIYQLQQSSWSAELHDSRTALQALSTEQSGIHALGRVLWLHGFLLWYETRNKCGHCGHTGCFPTAYAPTGQGGRTNPSVQYVPTTGTILVLKFAEVINLTEEYYAPRSLGTISLQINVQAQNNQNEDWAAKSYELVIMTLNSGVFVNDRGTSSTFLPCSQRKTCWTLCNNNPTLTLKSRRLVGGGCLDNVRSTMGWIQSRLPADTGTLEHVLHQYAHTGANVLNTLGYGKGETHRPQANMIKRTRAENYYSHEYVYIHNAIQNTHRTHKLRNK